MDNVLLKCVFGSHLYGTAIETSDNDFRGVYLPSREDCFLNTQKEAVTAEEEEDTQYFSLQKFLRLAAEGQSVSLELLFSSPNHWVQSSPIWEELHANRHRFISKKMSAFMGYSKAMAGKYSSRADRLNDVVTLKNFLTNASITDVSRCTLAAIWDRLPESANLVKTFSQFSTAADKRVYQVSGRDYTAYITVAQLFKFASDIEAEYGKRVRAAQEGSVDYKSVAHAFRVTYQCRALLSGDLKFPLAEADYIRDIRVGKVDFVQNKLDEKLQLLIEDTDTLLRNSSLPDSVDWDWCKNFILQSYE